MDEWVLALVGSPWVFVALYVLVAVDGFFPPIPSESAVIALAALSIASGLPDLWLVVAVAAVGAFTGDLIAYSIGRRIPVRHLRFMRGPRAQRTVDWAERALAERGATFILAARYVPVGRVAVNMTAGAVGFSRARFTGLAGIAAVTWSLYSVALGMSAGVWLEENPMLAVVVGVVLGLLLGLVLDPLLKHVLRGRRGRPAARPGVAAPPAAELTAPRAPAGA